MAKTRCKGDVLLWLQFEAEPKNQGLCHIIWMFNLLYLICEDRHEVFFPFSHPNEYNMWIDYYNLIILFVR